LRRAGWGDGFCALAGGGGAAWGIAGAAACFGCSAGAGATGGLSGSGNCGAGVGTGSGFLSTSASVTMSTVIGSGGTAPNGWTSVNRISKATIDRCTIADPAMSARM
jgi:hypothetical protein